MYKRILPIVIALIFLVSSLPGMATSLAKEELYTAALNELKAYLNDNDSMAPQAICDAFSNLGTYEYSAELAIYTRVLADAAKGDFQITSQMISLLRMNEAFCAYAQSDTGLGSIDELEAYVQGLQAELGGDYQTAVYYYQKSMSFMDSFQRTADLLNKAPISASSSSPSSSPSVVDQRQFADWTLDILSSGTASITKYTGTSTTIEIPDRIAGYTISAIGPSAFEANTQITVIVIPETVTTIGPKAFNRCSALTSITLPNSLTNVGDALLASCSNLREIRISSNHPTLALLDGVLIDHQAKKILCYPNYLTAASYQIPSSITAVGDHAFSANEHIATVIIPDSVVSIGRGVFVSCTGLQAFIVSSDNPTFSTVNDALYNKQENALVCCPAKLSKQAFQIPEGTKSIQDFAFHGCSTLNGITIPDGVTSIGASAFALCSELTGINIPDSVTSIGESAFSRCSKLGAVHLSWNLTSISNGTFYCCSALASLLVIPEGVTNIGANAFHSCSSLSAVALPSTLVSIDMAAFARCSSLNQIVFSYGITTIGESAFSGCTGLRNIALPQSISYIGNGAFYGCQNLQLSVPTGSYAETYASQNGLNHTKN